jgi:hypothetical protein
LSGFFATSRECVRVRRLTRAARPAERTGPETGPRVSEFTLLIDGINPSTLRKGAPLGYVNSAGPRNFRDCR